MVRDSPWAKEDVAGRQGVLVAHQDAFVRPAKLLPDELREAADAGRKVMSLDEQASDLPGPRVQRDEWASVPSGLLERSAWQPAVVPQALVPLVLGPLAAVQLKLTALQVLLTRARQVPQV